MTRVIVDHRANCDLRSAMRGMEAGEGAPADQQDLAKAPCMAVLPAEVRKGQLNESFLTGYSGGCATAQHHRAATGPRAVCAAGMSCDEPPSATGATSQPQTVD
jgi:hypothetical protein